MNLQLWQTHPIDPKTRHIQSHHVPPLTYIAPAFHSYKEREVRKILRKKGKAGKVKKKSNNRQSDDDYSTESSSTRNNRQLKQKTKKSNIQRPQSAVDPRFRITNELNSDNDDKNLNYNIRTASDATAVLRNQTTILNNSPLKETIPPKSALHDKIAFRNSMKKLLKAHKRQTINATQSENLAETKKTQSTWLEKTRTTKLNDSNGLMDDYNESNSTDNQSTTSDDNEENIEATEEDKMKQTELLLRKKLENLRQERMLLERQFMDHGFESPRKGTTTTLLDKETERFNKHNGLNNNGDDDNNNSNSDDTVNSTTNSEQDSVMSFEDRDDMSIGSDDLAGQRIKILKTKQEDNLAAIENVYQNKNTGKYDSNLQQPDSPRNTLKTAEVNEDLDKRIEYHYARFKKFQKKIDATNGLVNPNESIDDPFFSRTQKSSKHKTKTNSSANDNTYSDDIFDSASLESHHKSKITIPVPFKFDERDKKAKLNHKMSIREKKLRATLEQKAKEENDALTFQFRANPVPLTTISSTAANSNFRPMKKLIKSYDNKTTNSNNKNTIRPSTARTALQKSKSSAGHKFSISHNIDLDIFHYDDDAPFQAKDVPWFVKVKLYDSMMEEQTRKRRENCEKRAQTNLRKSKLPPRMQKYLSDESSKIDKIKKIEQEMYKEYTFTPKLNHSVPDFHKFS